MVDFRELVKAGVHFGHQTSRWNPKMAPYIWGFKNKVHLIDVSKTAYHLERSAQFLESVAAEGKSILWIGTKKPAQKTIEAVANKLDMPYVSHRWIGGTLSNREQVQKAVTKLLHYEDILAKSEKFPHYTKKELNLFQKVADRLESSVGGIRKLKAKIGAVVLVDAGKEASALKEAIKMNVPVVALVDTNCDPSLVDYVIPANDDAESSIKVVLNYLVASVEKGKAVADQHATKAAQEKALEAATKKAEAKKEVKKASTKKEDEPKKAAPAKAIAKKTITKKEAPKKAATEKKAEPKKSASSKSKK